MMRGDEKVELMWVGKWECFFMEGGSVFSGPFINWAGPQYHYKFMISILFVEKGRVL